MRYLRPMRLKQSYYKGIEALIEKIFYEDCYVPIIEAFAVNGMSILNANDPISTALRKGKIFFFDGVFKGEFDAKLTKEFKRIGAVYDSRFKGWKLKTIPVGIQGAIADADLRIEKIRQQILINLNGAQLNRPALQDMIADEYKKVVHEINQDFLKTIKNVTIAPELTLEMQANIANAWANNLELYIKKWSGENILKLRQEVSENVYYGNRAASMVKSIQQNYGVSKRKAKFLARQETSLLMSNLRAERYKDAGITRYKWSGVMDERERPDHKLLEDTMQTWETPPVVDRQNMRRAHPGEDFGCRCVAVPIVD